MTALAAGMPNCKEISDPKYRYAPQKGSTIFYKGATVMLDTAGLARPAAASVAGAICPGVYDDPKETFDRSDTTGIADSVKTIGYKEGVFARKNDGTNPVLSTTQPGTPVFALDDQTVSLSDSNGTRPFCGILHIFENSVPFIEMSLALSQAYRTDKLGAGALTDPGNAGAISVSRSGYVPLVSAGAETRTVALPTFVGQELSLMTDTYVGNIVITFAAAINQAGNTIATMGAVRDFLKVQGVTVAGALRWQVIANDGAALS